jgi:hypothetical protein
LCPHTDFLDISLGFVKHGGPLVRGCLGVAFAAGARKYRLNLTIANQYLAQMEETTADAVFGNVGVSGMPPGPKRTRR